MHVEKGPRSGSCEPCNCCNHSRVPAERFCNARRKVELRTLCALGASCPDEIHCCGFHSQFRRTSFFKSHRHSTTARSSGKIPISRKGFIKFSGRLATFSSASSDSHAELVPFTTSQRLTAPARTRAA